MAGFLSSVPAVQRRARATRIRLLAVTIVLLTFLTAWMVALSATLAIEGVEIPIAGLPWVLDGFTIAQITDIHGRRFDPRGPLVTAIKAAGVDIIVATGDFVDGSLSELQHVSPLLEALTSIAPTYAVSGNHDHWVDWPAVAAVLRRCGVIVLENDHVTLVRGDDQLILAGVSDPVTGRHDLASAIPRDTSAPVILLAHAPILHRRLHEGEGGELALLKAVSLTLVGHTHGGQIKLPLVGAVSDASGRAFPRSYVEGLSWEGYGWLYISRGLGYTILPLRFLSRPELTIITLRAGQ